MRWGVVPADAAGQLMADALQGRRLYFVSVWRITLIWETSA